MSTHTPGPWHAGSKLPLSRDDHGFRLVAEVRSMRVYAERDRMVQEGRGAVWGRSEDDACLIAASPDGYALAVAVAAHFEGTDAPLGKQARDFLAKATGAT